MKRRYFLSWEHKYKETFAIACSFVVNKLCASDSNIYIHTPLFKNVEKESLEVNPILQLTWKNKSKMCKIMYIIFTYIHLYSKMLKRRVWRLTLYYNSPGKIRVKCVKLCTYVYNFKNDLSGKIS